MNFCFINIELSLLGELNQDDLMMSLTDLDQVKQNRLNSKEMEFFLEKINVNFVKKSFGAAFEWLKVDPTRSIRVTQ